MKSLGTKAILYRIISATVSAATAYMVTDNAKIALTLGLLDSMCKTSLYWGYDIIWSKMTTKPYVPSIVWLTGLSGAGKTTIAQILQKRLTKDGHKSMILDGDELRAIFPGTGFDEESRKQHMRRVGQMATYLQSQGITGIVALISPYKDVRKEIKAKNNNFIEVWVDASLEICEQRDPKKLYAKARRGEIKGFTGIDAPYENPTLPDVYLDTYSTTPDACVNRIVNAIDDQIVKNIPPVN